MLNKVRKEDLIVTGRSAFLPETDPIVTKETELVRNTSPIDQLYVPHFKNCWYLNDYHLDEFETYKGLRVIDDVSRRLNSIKYDEVERNPGNVTKADIDDLANKFFPVTLGSSLKLTENINDNTICAPLPQTFSPPGNGLPPPPRPWRLETPHNRQDIRSEWKPIGSHLAENIRYLKDRDQVTKDTSLLSIETPYQAELSRLRLKRLRLEEELLMEVKRQEELDRIRGPQPKWYELRSSQFHYEAHKNNELLKSCDSWQNLMDYRSNLTKSSEKFRHKYFGKIYDPTNYVSVA